jgi:hypothetical protein
VGLGCCRLSAHTRPLRLKQRNGSDVAGLALEERQRGRFIAAGVVGAGHQSTARRSLRRLPAREPGLGGR